MQAIKYIFLFSLALFIMQSCEESRLNLDIAIVPREVTNFIQVNSAWDDYNSAGPLYFAGDAFTLVFSTNRNSNGADFDLVSYTCYVNYDQVKIFFDIWADSFEDPLIDTINTNYNEWGPYLTFDYLHQHFNNDQVPDTARLFFSSDREGNQDIYYCYYSPGGGIFSQKPPVLIDGLNTAFEEGYLCIHTGGVTEKESTATSASPNNLESAVSRDSTVTLKSTVRPESAVSLDSERNLATSLNQGASGNPETCYFTSNREGSFDIFRAIGEANRRIETSGSLQVSKVNILSSASDDKCPYIIGDMMVFTSDREGGQGGFDLWYSIYENGAWSTPENFGPGINTKYDEYRPVIIPLQPDLFVNDMLIFSSNRPGGKGGFDLYYTGLDKRDTLPESAPTYGS